MCQKWKSCDVQQSTNKELKRLDEMFEINDNKIPKVLYGCYKWTLYYTLYLIRSRPIDVRMWWNIYNSYSVAV